MSHSIVFETKFVKLSDGRLLHLNRSGCNNDNAGRNLSNFTGKLYTTDELIKHIESFMKDGKGEGYDLKIGSRYCTYYEYGEHLLRMSKRAISYDVFSSERCFYAERCDGIELLEPEKKTLTPKEFDDCYYDLLYGGKRLSYSVITSQLYNELEIINALENKEEISFYVGKKY